MAPPCSPAVDDPDLFAGDVLQYAVPVFALGATWHFDDSEGARQLLKDYAGTMLTTFALKVALSNTSLDMRPNGGRKSFPSGHTASACAGGFFLAERYGWKWGTPALLAAVFTGYTRVDEHYHHIRDVVAGCALGYGFSRLFVTRQLPRGAVLAPTVSGNSVGLAFRMRL
jgi:membrane-associated phospholipid phosphatase